MILRVALGVVGFLLVAFALYGTLATLEFVFIFYIHTPIGLVGGLCLWYALGGGNPSTKRRILCAFKIGMVCGLFTFVVLFIGPMLVTPGANQGPLGGFLFGPLGFALGAIIGVIFPNLCVRFSFKPPWW